MFASMRRSQKNEGNMARIQGEIGKASWWQQNRRIEREGSSAEGVEKQKAFTTQMWYQGMWFFFFFLPGREAIELQILLREDNMKMQRKAKMAWETEMEDEA